MKWPTQQYAATGLNANCAQDLVQETLRTKQLPVIYVRFTAHYLSARRGAG